MKDVPSWLEKSGAKCAIIGFLICLTKGYGVISGK